MIIPVEGKQKWILFGLYFILTISFFIKLGVQPLFQEEPRRALVALEMIHNDNIIVPTEFGVPYFKKPPLWNWVIIASYQLFGNYSEFAIRFFSALSHLLMGLLVLLAGKKYVSFNFGVVSSLFYLIAIDIYFYFSMLGEIDIFYSLLTFGSFLSLHHFYHQNKKWAAFLLFYALNGLGFLTKGFPSLVFAGLTPFIFFFNIRQFWQLFSVKHIVSALVFPLILALYFYLYYIYSGNQDFIDILWSRSAQRTILEMSFIELAGHLIKFPLKTLQGTIPVSILALIALRKKHFSSVWQNAFLRFMLLLFVGHFLVYLISPGALQRYIYMLYPPVIMVFSYFFMQEYVLNNRLFNILFLIFSALIMAFPIYLLFSPLVVYIPNIKLIILITFILYSLNFLMAYRISEFRFLSFILLFIITRLAFNFTILPYRAIDSEAQINKDHGLEIAKKTNPGRVFLYQNDVCSRITIFYAGKSHGIPIHMKKKLEIGNYYIMKKRRHQLEGNYKVVYEFTDGNRPEIFQLVYVDGQVKHKELFLERHYE